MLPSSKFDGKLSLWDKADLGGLKCVLRFLSDIPHSDACNSGGSSSSSDSVLKLSGMFSCSNFLEEINTKIHVISREYRAQSSDETGLCVDAEHTNALYAAALTRTFGLYAFLNTGVFKSEILRMALNRLDAPTLDNDEQPTSEPSKRETGTSATLESIFTELYRTLASLFRLNVLKRVLRYIADYTTCLRL